jgi:RNA polymerase sigma-70 factor (ECF subfamily)
MREATLTAGPADAADAADAVDAVDGEQRRGFEAFVARETPAVLRLARRLLGDEEAARDLAQDALLRAHQRLASFRGESSLKTWVLRITVNEGLKRLRRRRLKERVSGWLRPQGAPRPPGYGLQRTSDPEHQAGLHEQAAVLARALDDLPARQRTVLVLRYLEGRSVAEIAEALGVGPGTVKTHLVRAVRRVRRAWPRLEQEVDDAHV